MISLEIFQQLAQSTNDVITVTAAAPLGPPGPIIVYVNPAFTALTGYDANEVIGQSTRLLHGPKTDPRTVADVRAAMEAQRPIRVEQLHYKHDGEEFWIDTNIVPLRDSRRSMNSLRPSAMRSAAPASCAEATGSPSPASSDRWSVSAAAICAVADSTMPTAVDTRTANCLLIVVPCDRDPELLIAASPRGGEARS